MKLGLNLFESCSDIVLHLKCRELLIHVVIVFYIVQCPKKFAQSVLLLFTLEKYVNCDCGHVFVLRRTTRIRIKSRKLAVRALEAEIEAFVNCRKHGKEEQV